MKVQCPFIFLLENRGRVNSLNCVYLDKDECEDIECCPGNGDAWCAEIIERALDRELI